MFDKVTNLLKMKDVIIPRTLLYKYKDIGLNDQEFIVIIYLLNMTNSLYNPKKISENLKIELIDVLTIVSNLCEKGILQLDMIQRASKKAEVIKLDGLYDKLAFYMINEQDKKDTSIFAAFESEFARPLSPMEYELINAWKDASYSDEIILAALKEAKFNGVSNFKYIDKILDEWNNKGIKTVEDVEKNRRTFRESKEKGIKKEIFSYDWLNDEE